MPSRDISIILGIEHPASIIQQVKIRLLNKVECVWKYQVVVSATIREFFKFNNNIYYLQLGRHPVAGVIFQITL